MGVNDGEREGSSGTLTQGLQPEIPRGTSMSHDHRDPMMTTPGVMMIFCLLAIVGISCHMSVNE